MHYAVLHYMLGLQSTRSTSLLDAFCQVAVSLKMEQQERYKVSSTYISRLSNCSSYKHHMVVTLKIKGFGARAAMAKSARLVVSSQHTSKGISQTYRV